MKLLFTYLILLQTVYLYGQKPYRFISYNVSDGLSQNSIHSIFQDSDGLLWLGTQDGLNSFDGKNFKSYKYNPADSSSLSDHFVLSIAEDKQEHLWVGTGNGLNELNKRTGKIIRHYLGPEENKKIQATYSTLLLNERNEVFVPHYAHPIFIKTDGKNVYAGNNLTAIQWRTFDKEGNLWGLTKDKAIVMADKSKGYEKNTVTTTPKSFSRSTYTLFDIIIRGNILWLYSNEPQGRIYFYDLANKKWLNDELQLPATINHINITSNNVGWVSTLNGIYLLSDFKIIQHLQYSPSDKNSILPGSILCSYEDKQGNIWIGSASAGFAYYNPSFDNYQLTSSGIENNAVTSAVDVADSKWLGTASGLFRFAKNGQSSLVKVPELFPGKRITAITKDKENRVWVAVQNEGLYIYNSTGKLIKGYQQNDSLLSARKILNLFTDSKGRVFVCTETGYFVFSAIDKWLSFFQDKFHPTSTGWYVLHAFEDAQKNIWLSKHLGVDVLDEDLQLKKQIESKDASSPINRAIVTACTQDKNGDMWIATLRSGIYLYQNEQLKQFSTADGLSSNLIYGITCDGKGRIWATSTSGINVYVPEEKRFYSLTSRDGLPADEYVLGALFNDENGNIIAGSSMGLITIESNRISLQEKKVQAQINGVKINGQSAEQLTGHYVLKPGYKTFGFEFSIKESLQPKNIFYQYRLKGVDDSWSNLSSDNASITYTTLPFKKMTMQVRAAYSLFDLETASVEEFSFEVKPPFWKTVWFRVALGLLAIGIVFWAIRQYNKIKYKKQLEALKLQQELQQERERISRDLHDNIGAYTSALIAGINQLKAENINRDENIAELNDYASNIMGYLRETIWVLNNQHLTLTAFTDRFKSYATRITKNYPHLVVNFLEQIENERELSPQISLNLFRVMQEALQNASKHADATAIDIKFASNHKIELSISDNGKGIGNTKRNDSYGLTNMKERSSEIGFNFILDSGEGKGTTVLLTENSTYAV